MGTVATFDFPAFAAMYPEFATLDPAAAAGYFAQAGLYLANDGSGPISDPTRQSVLMNLLTAHIAKLFGTVNGVAPSGIVGRVASASQGSVSVSTDLAGLPGGAAWYAQTPYGLAFWTATAYLRTARYTPGPNRTPQVFPFGGYGYGGFGGLRGW